MGTFLCDYSEAVKLNMADPVQIEADTPEIAAVKFIAAATKSLYSFFESVPNGEWDVDVAGFLFSIRRVNGVVFSVRI